MYLKPTKDASNRYCISSKAEDFLFVIAYCIIHEYTNIRIEKTVYRDGSSVFTFYLEAIEFDNIQEIIEDSFTEKEGKYFDRDPQKNFSICKKESTGKMRFVW